MEKITVYDIHCVDERIRNFTNLLREGPQCACGGGGLESSASIAVQTTSLWLPHKLLVTLVSYNKIIQHTVTIICLDI